MREMTKSEVQDLRKNHHGCCNRWADNMACDCLDIADPDHLMTGIMYDESQGVIVSKDEVNEVSVATEKVIITNKLVVEVEMLLQYMRNFDVIDQTDERFKICGNSASGELLRRQADRVCGLLRLVKKESK